MAKVKYRFSVKRFLKGKGFYLTACACMIAVGLAAFAAVKDLPQPPMEDQSDGVSYTTSVTSQPKVEQTPVDALVSNQPDDRGEEPSSAPTPSEPASAPVATFFVPPVIGEIIKPFSATELQYSETFCDLRLHLGIDIAAENGSAVTAAGEGTVTAVKTDPLWGNLVEIDHGNGIVVKYCALAENLPVKVGDTVDSKTQIGVLTTLPCESVERSHLHVEVFKDGKAIDPLELLGI